MSCSKLFSCLLLMGSLFSIFSVNRVNAVELDEIEKEVIRLLQNREITELANELAAKDSNSTKELLIKISVFGRAGHKFRLSNAIQELVLNKDKITKNESWEVYKVVKKAIGNDFALRKFYYENLEINGDDEAREFIKLWKKNGDVSELEKWLFKMKFGEFWRDQWIRLKQELGTAEEIYFELEQEIRQNPNNLEKIKSYLKIVQNKKDVTWLLSVCKTETALQTFSLAGLFYEHPLIRQKLLEKSLTLPLTKEEDETIRFNLIANRRIERPAVNPEKQLRFWTQKALIKIHLENSNPQFAQQYVNEIAALDLSDIVSEEDIYQLAGTTQAGSGERVMEEKILKNEAERKDTTKYWIERIKYYKGRKEETLIWQTVEQALQKFPYNPKDKQILQNRFEILRTMRSEFLQEEKQAEIFNAELIRSKNNPIYLFKISNLVIRIYGGIIGDCRKFFSDPEILIRMMAVREKWNGGEHEIISALMSLKEIPKTKRSNGWKKLTKLAWLNPQERIPLLAYSMFNSEAYREAIPLLKESLKLVPVKQEGWFNHNHFKEWLYVSYRESGDWQTAEKLAFDGGYVEVENGLMSVIWKVTGKDRLAEIMRIWKKIANFDRRNLFYLETLAKNGMKTLFQEYYLEMKRKDPLSDIPDKALQRLN